jgi:mono/diheme cytochrome c family protein
MNLATTTCAGTIGGRKEKTMKKRGIPLFVASMASLVFAATVCAGGWAIATVRDLPEYAVVGKPLQLTFTIRQHGVSPAAGLKPTVNAKSGARMVNASAFATKTTGEYTAAMVLPGAGNWAISIENAYGSFTLPELKVIAAGSPAPLPLSKAVLGKRLFVSKGCIECHTNRDVSGTKEGGVGPDLTGKSFPETYLTSVLADPGAAFKARRRSTTESSSVMPRLGLTKSEIASLTAFINRPR